ncbi:GmrSD restriction endonuclease domain-containing protein [Wenzhouxiangella limi]|uniref:DUF262 domain-containing protein n=1 Tax=Wenzhouxiangella limi TaxID=2707351 RepID=A0A845UV04_9GAMM|nr:DUF262 domain-containing protein [Wenzhouxiangella limi]NDY94398.1 DUF262 domain-containing protein [Wenzhouxiangella limi]
MAFVEPITIKEAVDSLHRKKYLLPAIQREFVWGADQIERLFDSLMREYPINSFLFWQVDKVNIAKYQFYEFIREYHERDNRRNPKANIDGEHDVTAILDGQQRLTSLYIGLRGTYAYKLPRKRWGNDDAFPKRRLCLNLLAPATDFNLEYDFRFLTDKEAKQNDDGQFWFVVSDILNFSEMININEYLIENRLQARGDDEFRFANRSLYKLYEAIHKTRSINFFLEKGESLDKVLNIFVRVNSGGTELSYSDLLLSIATAQWRERDAREEIISFVDEINATGDGFNFNKDFVLKSCLVLSGFRDIAFKVDNFNQKNMLIIEKHWENITKAIKSAIVLASSLGYHRDSLTSSNALIPIASYLYKIGSPENFAESAKFQRDRQRIFKWLVKVLLKRTFSGQPDNVLRPIRDVINDASDDFPLDQIVNRLKGTPKAISFDDDEIDNLLCYKYGQPYTYSALAFIYPALDFKNKFHQDHIFPKKLFTRKEIESHGIPPEDIDFYLEKCNCIANLQLLEGVPNQEKSGREFDVWIKEKYPDREKRQAYMERHFIPDIDLSFENFRRFITEREKLLVAEFKRLLKH